MATGLQGLTLYAAAAGEDLSNYLFHFIMVHTDGTLKHAAVNSEVIGSLIETATIGNPASVQCDGIGKIVLGATLNAGVTIMPNTNGDGTAVAATGSPPGTNAGILLVGGNSGETVTYLIK